MILTDALLIGDEAVLPGERKTVHLRVSALYDFTEITVPVEVIRGEQPGPTLFIAAAVHGDEINGVEIIRRLIQRPFLKRLRGTLLAVPIVNVFGFNNKSRYLPDRRDLNRSFPGSRRGSLASRLAHVFMQEVVLKSDYGLDLHTGAVHRYNLPQIRVSLDDPRAVRLAKAFAVPVIMNSDLRDGSLRSAAHRKGIPILVYEGGEALRFNESVIRAGVRGCISVMQEIQMLPQTVTNKSAVEGKDHATFIARDSRWVRAPRSGAYTPLKSLGDRILEGEVLAVIADPLGKEECEVISPEKGIIVGASRIPLVNQGDAMFHVATFKNNKKVRRMLERYENEYSDE